MFCPNCGKKNDDDSRFCEACGSLLHQENKEHKVCKDCGTSVNDPDALFCPECGKRLDEESKTILVTPKISEEESNSMFIQDEEDWKPEKKKYSNAVLITLGIIAVIMIIAVAGLIIWYFKESKEDDSSYSASANSNFTTDQDKDDESEDNITSSPAPTEVPEVTSTPEATPEPTPTEEPKEHEYELVIDDCTWEQARENCLLKGGYLARIETSEEYEYLLQFIEEDGMGDKIFFIGARREMDGNNYCWVDDENELTGKPLNDGSSPLYSRWMAGEPSYMDQELVEDCVVMSYYKGESRWVINDVPNAILDAVKSYSGRIGYICEYEE